MPKVNCICKKCEKVFSVPRYTYNFREVKFCSNDCKYGFGLTKIKCLECGKEFIARKSTLTRKHPLNKKYCSLDCKNIAFKKRINDEAMAWKGEDAGYDAIHRWVYSRLGRPDICEHCGKSGLIGHQIHWTNIDHKYRRVVEDWIRLCVDCHYEYDIKNNLRYGKTNKIIK